MIKVSIPELEYPKVSVLDVDTEDGTYMVTFSNDSSFNNGDIVIVCDTVFMSISCINGSLISGGLSEVDDVVSLEKANLQITATLA